VGDLVLAFDPTSESGRGDLHAKRVTHVFERSSNQLVELNGSAGVTSGHLFLTADGTFKKLSELSVGDALGSEHGRDVPIRSLRRMKEARVYNFTVEDLHTYIAAGYRVHNDSALQISVSDGGATVTIIDNQDDGTVHIWNRSDENISSEM